MFKSAFILVVVACLSMSALAAKKSDPTVYSVKWKERSGRISHQSVCYNYDDGSIPYRRCRVQAQKHFVQQCRHFTAKYEKTKAPYNKSFRKKRDKFCYSADRYYPF